VIQRRVKEIREATPLTEDPAVMEASVMMVRTKVALLRCLIEAIEEYEHKIEELFGEHPDHEVFESLPGAGEALAPRLLTVFGTDRDRYAAADEIQQLSGVAPVTKQSGNSLVVQRRLACPKFVLQTFVEHAEQSRKKPGWASEYYNKQRDRGVSHHAALRALAYKWIRIIFRCWKDRVPYDEQIYQAALLRRRSRQTSANVPSAKQGGLAA
jgi:transposase